MKIRTRLILAMLALIALGFCSLVFWIIDDLRPRYLATMEESMVDIATIFASFLEHQLDGETIRVEQIRHVVLRAHNEKISAQIYEELKDRLELRVYVTDRRGIVLFDSDRGRDEGRDYSRWLDVALTLQGKYGARNSREVKRDPSTAVLYVAAPIRANGKIVGAITVCKKAKSATRFMIWARKRIILTGVLGALAIALLGAVVYTWITIPMEKLTEYAKAVRDGRRAALPTLGRNEIGELGTAFEQMRDALEGKEYISEYVQTLTHEMKSPLSAIRGAAELLEEEMPAEQRNRFLENIRAEGGRMQDLIDRLLQLSALEKRKGLHGVEAIDLPGLLREILTSLAPLLSARNIAVEMTEAGPPTVRGESFLIRQALVNLFQNAIDFSPPGGKLGVSLKGAEGVVEVVLDDEGPGVPDYALGRVFDRFYSLQRPDSGKKSSGLGLTIVREVASLHGGSAGLENGPAGGARAILRLPVEPG